MTVVAPQVHLIAHSHLVNLDAIAAVTGWTPHQGEHHMDSIGEFAGRACYQSFNRPHPERRDVMSYLRHILESNHMSVLRHASATFYITGISRSLTHELVVHKHLAHSQLSQRYHDESEAATVMPPAYLGRPMLEKMVEESHGRALEDYQRLVAGGAKIGLARKESREAARSVLPNANETRIVVTGNLQAWRQYVAVRWSTHADAEIRHVADLIRKHLLQIAPASVQDLPSEPYGTPGTFRPLDQEQEKALRETLGLLEVDPVDVDRVLDALGPR